MTLPSSKYTPDSTANCPMQYTVVTDSSTFPIAGVTLAPTLTVGSPDSQSPNLVVNASPAALTIIHTFSHKVSVTLKDNTLVVPREHVISIKVYPCVLNTPPTINIEAQVGNSKYQMFHVSFVHQQNTAEYCGTVIL
jgi:hypothetical protein